MASSTFHPFPRLPFEIRQQIWGKACLEWHEDRGGLHYISLDSDRQLAPLNCCWDATGPNHKSAYMWHAGLWRACKESRDVVAKQWHNEGWPDDQERTEYLHFGDVILFTSKTPKEREAIVHTRGDYEPWHLIVDPDQDIFCIRADNWEPLLEDWKPICLTACDHYGFYDFFHLLKVGLEFDPAWSHSIASQDCYHPFQKYPASLAFLMGMLFDLAPEKLMLPKIRLIDDNARWKEDRPNQREVFFDCDHDYVEIDVCYYSPSRRIVGGSSILDFLDQLDRLLSGALGGIHCRRDRLMEREYHDYDRFSVQEMIIVVVRRDNQITKGEA